jgi:hypothetical protein
MPPDEVCTHHEKREDDMQRLHDTVSRHSGQWKVLLIILGLTLGSMYYFSNKNAEAIVVISQEHRESIGSIEASTRRIELTFSNYMAAHKAEAAEGFRRIVSLESGLHDHEKRIRILEK